MSRESLSKSEAYIAKHFAVEDQHLARIREALQRDQKFGINVGAPEGKLLQTVVGLLKPEFILEIGTLYGYSTLWMARALVDGGKIISLEKDPNNFKAATELAAQSDAAKKIEIRNGDALQLLETISAEIQSGKLPKPNVVFIDADKGNYKNYLNWAMENVRVGGLIIGDNTFLFGNLIGEDRGESASKTAMESMSYFNETLAKASNFRAAMIPTYEGMTIAERLH